MGRQIRTATREISVAGHCMQAGQDALEKAQSYDDDYASWRTANVMAAMSMWAFALEADVNHLLQRLSDSKPSVLIESKSTLEKIYWLTLRDRIRLFFDWAAAPKPDFGKEPFAVVRRLKSVRDAIAHGKPELFEVVVEVTDGQLSPLPRELTASWEAECTVANAIRVRDDVIAVHQIMVEAAGLPLGDPMSFTAVLGLGHDGSGVPA